jgi:hypothetical protein
MPITFAGAGTKATTDISSPLTLNAPASPQNDDIWVAVVASIELVNSLTVSDWTVITNATRPNSNLWFAVWWFRYAGSNPDLTIDLGVGNTTVGGIASFRGCKTTGSPINVTGTVTDQGTGSATIAHTGVTITAESALLVINASIDDNTRTAIGGDYTSAFSEAGNNAYTVHLDSDVSMALSYDLSATGVTGTVNQTQSGTDDWVSMLVALEAAPGGQPYDYREGNVSHVGMDRNWGGLNALFRKSLSGLLVPRKPRLIWV